MTTIVLDKDFNMASDSQMSLNDERIQHPATKIWHIQGHTIGIAGAYAKALAFVEAFEDSLERMRIQKETFSEIPQGILTETEIGNFNAIVVTPKNKVLLFEGSRFSIPSQAPTCIGTGSPYAYGALDMGANAAEAVAIACKYDLYSGGDVKMIEHTKANEEAVPKKPDELLKMSRKQILEYFLGDYEAAALEEE